MCARARAHWRVMSTGLRPCHGVSASRRPPSAHQAQGFDPQVDSAVEVLHPATEEAPSGWQLGRVTDIKNKCFYFVTFEATQRSAGEKSPPPRIVELGSLRKASATTSIDAKELTRRQVPVDKILHEWVRSEDFAGCLQDVQLKSGLLAVSCNHATDPVAKGQPKISLLGDVHAVDLGEKLLRDIHFKQQTLMQHFNEQREKMLAHLRELQEEWNTQKKECFPVQTQFVGRIIGKEGSNIKRIRDEHDVEIWVPKESHSDETWITVTGKTAEAARKAREEMEFMTVKIEVEPGQVGFFVGKQYGNLREISDKCELAYARFDDKTTSIELCGLSHQVEAAKMMIMVHRDYLPVYKDMGQERDDIQAQFAELDEQDFKGKGKKSKGKEKKGEQSLNRPSESKGAGKGKDKEENKGKGKDTGKSKGEDIDKGKAGKDKEKGKGGKADRDLDIGREGDVPDKGKGKAKGRGKRESDEDTEAFTADKDGEASNEVGKGKAAAKGKPAAAAEQEPKGRGKVTWRARQS
mmetsp:Transcript_107828/g.292343  ORF Transcript_107828/g.292343 Transcript_107828/m.292343 type:complete len:522 (+) Transcript_107828:181-1746(+)